jgi:hypothetical protein
VQKVRCSFERDGPPLVHADEPASYALLGVNWAGLAVSSPKTSIKRLQNKVYIIKTRDIVNGGYFLLTNLEYLLAKLGPRLCLFGASD